ncbi:LuxR C-terminal-related transcriptional regulator [Chloroflexota bacterium]
MLVLTQYDDREHVIGSFKAGASGYIPKRASGSGVVSAIYTVHCSEYFLFPSTASTLIRDYLLHQPKDEPYDHLTSKEREALRLVVDGQTSHQIADRSSISLKTVRSPSWLPRRVGPVSKFFGLAPLWYAHWRPLEYNRSLLVGKV